MTSFLVGWACLFGAVISAYIVGRFDGRKAANRDRLSTGLFERHRADGSQTRI